MNRTYVGGALALPLLLAACGEKQNAAPEKPQPAQTTPAASQGGESYSAAGEVKAIAGNQVTIAHGPVEGIGWPAMTMSFEAQSPRMIEGVSVGDSVSFDFRQDGSAYVLTSLSKTR